MPFGLKNAGATFQWAMDMAFANEKDVFLVVYLDDLTVFSKSDEEHLYHLTMVFQKCRKYGILLNPKKSLFAMSEGKLLGHIISKDGIPAPRVFSPQQVEGVSPSSSAPRALSPHQVEGASLPTIARVSERGKQPRIEEGLSYDPDIDIIDIEDSSPASKLKEIIREQRTKNESLHKKLQMEKWVINYLE
eukprot:PITA_31564